MKTVLIAEDTAELRELMTFALTRAGFKVIEACNGMEALRLFKQHPEISAVVTDLDMPMMNGIQLVQEIKGVSNLPIIMWSGSMNPGLKITFIPKEEGSKPVIAMLEVLLSLEEAA